MTIEYSYYRRADIRARRNCLFVFGDNLERRGKGGQAREARGEPNAVGIPTKRAPRRDDAAFLNDADWPRVILRWREAFTRINQHLLAGGTVVWPRNGVGTGRAELEKRAPVLWNELHIFIAGMEAVAATTAEISEAAK